jgi:rRNA maturation protein Nop10
MSTTTRDRNYPVTDNCPHCGNRDALLMPRFGDYKGYQCPKCGDYRLSGSCQKGFDNGVHDPRNGRFVVRDGTRYLEP